MELKNKLLLLSIVEDNEYLTKYCNLITNNRDTIFEKGKMHRHHIIPKSYYKIKNIPIDNSKDNIVNFSFMDHILAHYYLSLCSIDLEFKYANELAFMYLTNNNKYPIAGNEKELITSLPYFQKLYEEGNKTRGEKNKGKKRSLETRKKMSAWQKGKPKPEEAKKNMSIAQKTRVRSPEEIQHWQNCLKNRSEEEKKKTFEKISNKLKGRIASEDEKRHKSLALKGKPKTEMHKKHLSEAAKKNVGEKASRSILQEKQVIEILRMLKDNKTLVEIANYYKVSTSCISDIKHKRKWKYLYDLYPELYSQS